jgi:hypothetical protein
MKKQILARIGKTTLLTSCLALMVACTNNEKKQQADTERKATLVTQKYEHAKQELSDFITKRDSLLWKETDKFFNKELSKYKLGDFFTTTEINRMNEMIQLHLYDEEFGHIETKYNPYLANRSIYNIVLTPKSNLADFWACGLAFEAYNDETQKFSTPFTTDEIGYINTKNNKTIRTPMINCQDVCVRSIHENFDKRTFFLPKSINVDHILQSDKEDKLHTTYKNYQDSLSDIKNTHWVFIKKNDALESAKKMPAKRPATLAVQQQIANDILDMETELDSVKTKLLNKIKQNPKYKLGKSLSQKQLDSINQQIIMWRTQYADSTDTAPALTSNNSIFDLADFAHILSADIVYESNDDNELIWTIPTLQAQWEDLQNLYHENDLFETECNKNFSKQPETIKFKQITKQIADKKRTMRTIDSVHNAMHKNRIYKAQQEIDRLKQFMPQR